MLREKPRSIQNTCTEFNSYGTNEDTQNLSKLTVLLNESILTDHEFTILDIFYLFVVT